MKKLERFKDFRGCYQWLNYYYYLLLFLIIFFLPITLFSSVSSLFSWNVLPLSLLPFILVCVQLWPHVLHKTSLKYYNTYWFIPALKSSFCKVHVCLPQAGGLQKKVHFLIVLEARSLRLRCQLGSFFFPWGLSPCLEMAFSLCLDMFCPLHVS